MATIRRDCPHCPATHVAFTIVGVSPAPNEAYEVNALAHCGSCGRPIAFRANTAGQGVSPAQTDGDIERSWRVVDVWPERLATSAPKHTPPNIRQRFLEGEDAFARESWNAAVAMYRATLDIATKSLADVPANVTFHKRLVWLHDNHRITPDMKDWADHVRIEGNEALHDPEAFTEEDAKPLRLFTETFLRYVFELPGEVREFRNETDTE